MSYPKYVRGNGSLAVFKMFSPELGFALTNGCDMEAGTIITSERGTTELPFDSGNYYDTFPEWTAKRVFAERNLGIKRLPIEGQTTGVIRAQYKFPEGEPIPAYSNK